MSIPESQLETWSHQGSVTQSKDTYATVKAALERTDTRYAANRFEVFLQGSYGNDTNIYVESDVDIVIRLDSIFHYDLSGLTPEHRANFEGAYSSAGSYLYSDFKNDVIAALQNRFGMAAVKSGNRAVKVGASGSRRSSDVIVSTLFRRYDSFPAIGVPQRTEGICFFTAGGERIVNYPKQHSANCTAKHQATSKWFKPMVRILKNMRRRLVENGVIGKDCAPSYFLEGLLYNVPNDKFGKSYGDTFVAAVNWILHGAHRDKLQTAICASGQHYLVRDSSSTCWPYSKCEQFINAVVPLWNNWA